jgi:hypothetical protein
MNPARKQIAPQRYLDKRLGAAPASVRPKPSISPTNKAYSAINQILDMQIKMAKLKKIRREDSNV